MALRGYTPCLEFTAPDGTKFILDCGTGLRTLGNCLTEAQRGLGIDAHILVTHYHWDHIQGIPFFHPFFESQNRFQFYSFQSKYLGPNSLEQVFAAQLATSISTSPLIDFRYGRMAIGMSKS